MRLKRPSVHNIDNSADRSSVNKTAEKHVVLYTNKLINDRVTHNETLFNVEMRNLSFLPLRLLY